MQFSHKINYWKVSLVLGFINLIKNFFSIYYWVTEIMQHWMVFYNNGMHYKSHNLVTNAYSAILILASFISLQSDENNTWHYFHDPPYISRYTKHKNEGNFFCYLENPVKHIWISNQKLSNSSELSNYNIHLAQRPYIRQAIIAIIAVLLRNMNINEYASNISTYRT